MVMGESYSVRLSHLFKLQLGVDSDVADLTVEGAFLSVGVRGQLPSLLGTGFGTQAWVRFNGSQSASSLQNSFVFGAWQQEEDAAVFSEHVLNAKEALWKN